MPSSSSSSMKRDPNQYRWLRYDGRAIRLHLVASDKQEHDIQFEKGDLFGVKFNRGNAFILHRDQMHFQFKLLPKDAERILKNSVGYEGKIGRVKVRPSDKGKDSKAIGNRRRDGKKRLIADSSVFSDLYHDSTTNELYVQFFSGAIWCYSEVTAKEARSLENAASQGSFFVRRIRNTKPQHQVKKIPDTFASLSAGSPKKGIYNGEEVELERPFRTEGKKKFGVYVQDNDKVKLIRFGDPNMSIKKNDEQRRKSFMARHKCDQQTDKTTAAYWSCRAWELDADWS